MAIKAAILLSGGLDSLLAGRVLLEQGIETEGLNFDIGFGGKTNPAITVAKQLGIKLHCIDVIDEFKHEVFLKPKHGYGANLNPCLDCKIFMVKQALAWTKKHNFNFIATGEVVGQRPMSQRNDTMAVVAKQSGAEGLLLRPLCAKLLAPTIPEENGWVNREKLFDINGRSRKMQLELAAKFGYQDHPQPAGGCLLTDENFCRRLKNLWEFRQRRDYSSQDLELLKTGRHLKPAPNLRLIISHNEADNYILQNYQTKFISLMCTSHNGPLALLEGSAETETLEFAAKILARFSQGKNAEQVTVEVFTPNQKTQKFTVKPFLPNEVKSDWYI